MNKIFEVLWEYRYVIAFTLYMIVTCVTMGKQWTKKKALELMLAAKQMAKEGVLNGGQQQKEWVVEALYLVLSRFKIPVSKEMLQPMVEKAYLMAMDKMDDGKINNSISK